MLKESSVKISTSRNQALTTAIWILVALFLILTALPSPAFCASKKKDKTKNPATASDLNVVSDKMIAEQSKSMVEFIGHVMVTREDSILLADSVKVFFNPLKTKEQNQNSVKEIVATGNVEYTAGERKAFADKAVYTAKNEILVLTGKAPKMLTGKSYVTGKKITLFRLEERVMVESDGKKRVHAFFDSQDNKNKPTEKK